MAEATNYEIRIEIETAYLADQSDAEAGRFVF